MRTRWWLLLLPVATVLVVVATGSRLQLFWWPEQLHDVTTGEQGVALRVSDAWEDEAGEEQHRDLEVTLVDVVGATRVDGFSGKEDVVPPEGTAVWEISLRFTVDPDVPLGGCHISLLDADGRESDADGGSVADVLLPSTACEPEGRSGPGYDGSRVEGEKPRPETYVVRAYAVAAASTVPDRVRLWWEAPDVTELRIAQPGE